MVFGTVLLVTSGLSGWLRGTVLSISVLALGAGVALALAGVLERSKPATTASSRSSLILTLFTDGLTVERELLRERWREPVRALLVACPSPGR